LELRDSFPEEQWPALAHRLELAASSMDEAAVYTIHSWAQRMLSQHAFDSGSRFNLKLETDDRELYQEAAREYWRSFVYPPQLSVLESVLRCADCPDALARSIYNWPIGAEVSTSDLSFLTSVEKWLERYQQVEMNVRRQWQLEAADIRAWFDHALSEGWLNGN